jgi:hypothetical protein
VIKSKRIRWVGHVACTDNSKVAYRVLIRKPEGKRPHERPTHRWEANTKTDLQQVGRSGTDWTDLHHVRNRQPALVNVATNLWVT